MSTQDLAFHYVCTWGKAESLIAQRERFWVSNCGCRERRGECARSRKDVCLMFKGDIAGSGGSGTKEISQSEVAEILREARTKYLVARPFRSEKNMAETDGICFCCDDCCGYFLNREERCDKGELIECTDPDLCNNCGDCEALCHFEARKLVDGELIVDHEACYGCGLCVEICPENCVQMISRL